MLPKLSDVETRLWDEEGRFVLLVTATNPTRCASVEWFTEHRDEILKAADRFAIVFFRGFDADSRRFESLVDVLHPEPLPYLGGVSPRSLIHGSVFTATDSAKTLAVPMHHEMSYHSYSPHYCAFYCEEPAAEGGATSIADGRAFARAMEAAAPEVMDDLAKKRVQFVRNYTKFNFKSWQDTWRTSDKAELEQKLRDAAADFEWVEDDWLRTRQLRPGLIRDPLSGARVLFASINIWRGRYSSQINESYSMPLWKEQAGQPFGSTFGDGTPIPDDFVELMQQTYQRTLLNIPWQRRDFMFINNFVGAHGKQPWTGETRKIYVTLRHKVDIAKLPLVGGIPEAPLHA